MSGLVPENIIQRITCGECVKSDCHPLEMRGTWILADAGSYGQRMQEPRSLASLGMTELSR